MSQDPMAAYKVEDPTLRCAASNFESFEAALAWTITQIDQRMSKGGRVDNFSIVRYAPVDETSAPYYEANVVLTVP